MRGPGFLEIQDRAGRAGASERQRPDRSEGGLCLHTLCEGDLIQSKPVIPSGGGSRDNANKGPTARGPALGGRPASLSPRAQSPGRQLGAASPPAAAGRPAHPVVRLPSLLVPSAPRPPAPSPGAEPGAGRSAWSRPCLPEPRRRRRRKGALEARVRACPPGAGSRQVAARVTQTARGPPLPRNSPLASVHCEVARPSRQPRVIKNLPKNSPAAKPFRKLFSEGYLLDFVTHSTK